MPRSRSRVSPFLRRVHHDARRVRVALDLVVVSIGQQSRLLVKVAQPSAKQGLAVGLRGLRILYKIGLARAQQVKRAHYHLATRPHQHLRTRYIWYDRWHSNRHHHYVHGATLAGYIAVLVFTTGFWQAVFASGSAQTWDFSTPANFSIDAALENSGTSVRHKAQNYTTDADTVALYHLDENSGTSAADSSSNGNTGSVTSGIFGVGNLNNALAFNGTNTQISAPDSASLSLSQNNSLEAWTKFSSTFGAGTHDNKQGVIDKGAYKLYYDKETGKVTYELASASATTWTQQAGNDIKGSWDLNGKFAVNAQVAIGGNVYAGLGNAIGDAEVWKWDGTNWSMVGGDGKNSSWPDQTYENVVSMAASGTTLYAGLGSTAGDAEVWSCDTATGCTNWTKIGGDAINSSWPVNAAEEVDAMTVMGGNLYVGLGLTATTDSRIYKWNGTTWTWVGGNGVGAPYNSAALPAGYEAVYSLTNDGTNLYAGYGATAGDADVWKLSGTTWSQIGGDGLNSSWAAATYETVVSMRWFNGNLYAGLGLTAGDAEVWKWNGTAWSQIGGDAVNSSWAAATYEGVYSFSDDGTNLYAGLGTTAGDNEVWKWNGTAWSQIGGDGLNSGFTNTHTQVNSLLYTGGLLYAGLVSTANNAEVWSFNGTSWTRIGGGYINKSWGYFNIQDVESMTVSGDYLYAGTGNTVAGNAQVWRFDGNTWAMVGGQGINSSWPATTYENAMSMISYAGNLYVGLGTTANDAEVWKWNGSTWSQIGGDSLNSGWGAGFEEVFTMATYNGKLEVGLGNSANDAEVWQWNATAWTRIGGDSINSGWTANYERVSSLAVYGGNLYAGLGLTAGDAEVWKWNGTAWSKVGGDGLNASWNLNYEQVESMIPYNGKLYAGLGNSTGDAELWEYDGTSWTQIGGDGLASSWVDGQYEQVKSLAVYNGKLYAGLGNTAGDGEVWEYDNGAWAKVAGNSLNSSWGNAIETVQSFAVYHGKLYAGLGNTANADAQIWSYGGNGFLQSATVGQDTNWHHIAATYDGTTMKVYVDGTLDASSAVSLSLPDSDQPLLVGATFGGFSSESGWAQGYFAGQLDEVRISNIARSGAGFIDKPYSTNQLLVSPLGAVLSSGIASWSAFSDSSTLNGGTINYRLTTDNGGIWKYWNGSAWVVSASIAQSNTASVINSHISTFPVVLGGGIKWQAGVQGDGTQRVTLDSVTVTGIADTTPPEVNATNVVMSKTNGGPAVASNNWTNGASPYFSWTAGTDAGAGIYGYCLYLGQTAASDPISTKGQLGASPLDTTGTPCSFIVPSTNVDLATAGYLASPLASSNSPYYLYATAIDRAGNAVANTTTDFQFRFDNTAPSNPAFITAPSNFISTKSATLTWQTSGADSASDANAGLAGLQYRIGASSPWYGVSHNGAQDATDLLPNNGSYTTQSTPDFANLIEGNNTIYFRTWDAAGNVSPVYVTTALKINSSSPSSPQNLTATPASNSTNYFGFSWVAPTSFAGQASNITYCYTVNTTPTVANCSYTAAGVTNITAGAYATQPGDNTFYTVAKDEAGNINYATAASTIFTANTSAPGVPLNPDVVDASIKSTSTWRLALTWNPPASLGAGIAAYRIYRSTDNTTFSVVATTSSTSLVDTGLSQVTYFYKIKACDSTNNCGASSPAVSKLPTGRFSESANLLSQPEVSNVTTRRATIQWVTDRTSDSRIALGTKSGSYSSDEVSNSDQVTAHSINLTNLAAGTTYFAEAKWTDEDGNLGSSDEFSFTTAPAPSVKEVSNITIGLNSTSIKFTSKGAVSVKIYFGKTDSFGGTHVLNTSTAESAYTTQLTGLDDGTKYFYKVNTFDADGNEYDSSVFSFTTPSRPHISDLRFQPVAGEPTSTQLISWTTNVPTTSGIQYGPRGTNQQEVSDSKLTTDHQITISNLTDNTDYVLVATSRDTSGNQAVSDQQSFRTALDTRPPKVSAVTIEPSIKGTGSDAHGQIVISWKTDEPGTSQVEFGPGSSGNTYASKSAEDQNYTRDHVVIVSDLPTSTVFHFRAVSHDRAANQATSDDQSTIIGRATDSVLSIIFNALSNIFGFLK